MTIRLAGLSPPRKKESTYLMADFVELLCLISEDGEISIHDAVSRVHHSAEYETAKEVDNHEHSATRDHEGVTNDREFERGVDWFSNLAYRQGAFKECYPFKLIKGNILVTEENFTQKQLLYIFLLLCSNLRIVDRKSVNKLTADFEMISSSVFESYLPGFTVHHFGKSKIAREHYPNKLGEAIVKLARNLKEEPWFDPKDFTDKNSGDGGLDVVAWRNPVPDEDVSGSLICLGQCACSPDDWEDKQFESHSITWNKRIRFMHSPANFIFVPICFRDSRGQWFVKDKIRDSIMFDRLRICHLMKDVKPPIDINRPVEAFATYVS